jgi:hypothetical protein
VSTTAFDYCIIDHSVAVDLPQAIEENPSLLMSLLSADRKQSDAEASNQNDSKKEQRRKKAAGEFRVSSVRRVAFVHYENSDYSVVHALLNTCTCILSVVKGHCLTLFLVFGLLIDVALFSVASC